MKYLMFVCVDEQLMTPESVKDMPQDTIAWVSEMDGRGVRLQGSRLQDDRQRDDGARARG